VKQSFSFDVSGLLKTRGRKTAHLVLQDANIL
jgi:hypothetical protein